MSEANVDTEFIESISRTICTTIVNCAKCTKLIISESSSRLMWNPFYNHLLHEHGRKFAQQFNNRGAPQTGCSKAKISQESFDNDIVNFIVHWAVPPWIVEDQYFTSIFKNLQIKEQGVSVMNRLSLNRQIDERFAKNQSKIKIDLQAAPYVCIAICWSQSFYVVTAHWIDQDLKRASTVLAVRRGIYKPDEISHSLQTDFGLVQNKIVKFVHYVRPNFIYNFCTYGISISSINKPEKLDSNNLYSIKPMKMSFDGLCASKLHECTMINFAHLQGSHKNLQAIHTRVMKKCNLLWEAARSSETMLDAILVLNLNPPDANRWSSLYDSLQQIYNLKYTLDKYSDLCKALNITSVLNEQDFKYIEEHLTCAEPIFKALDLLHDQNNSYYGIVLPCLVALRRKLQTLISKEWMFCQPLAEMFFNRVTKEFDEFYNFTTPATECAAIAALSHPRFKNRWLECVQSHHQESILEAFDQAVSEICGESAEEMKNHEGEDDFFDFGSSSKSVSSQYFNDKRLDFDVLDDYPQIKKVFLKYNAPLPSLGPVERIASYATMKKLQESCNSSDVTFEKRALLNLSLKY